MVDAPAVVEPTVASQVDAQGNVVVYDHGPSPSPADAAGPVKEKAVAVRKDWDALHPEGIVPIRMGSTDAAHAIAADPMRYSLEPSLDEAAIAAKMAEIRKRREAQEKAMQDLADRRQAVQEVLSDHVNAVADKPKHSVRQQAHHVPKTEK